MVCFTKATWLENNDSDDELRAWIWTWPGDWRLDSQTPDYKTNCFTRWHFDKFSDAHYRHVCVSGAPTGSNVSWYLSEMLISFPKSLCVCALLSFSRSPISLSPSHSHSLAVHTINFPLVFRPTCCSCCCCSSMGWSAFITFCVRLNSFTLLNL